MSRPRLASGLLALGSRVYLKVHGLGFGFGAIGYLRLFFMDSSKPDFMATPELPSRVYGSAFRAPGKTFCYP